MGGGDINYPAQPPQPSTADAIREWVGSMPTVYETQLRYAPQQAAQQVALAQQYAGQLGQAYKTAQEAMYPETAALQEKMAAQASEGMQEGMPAWAREEYLSGLRANLGTNIGSPIAADYSSRGLMQQNKEWQDYYRNLGLTLAGRQPLAQPTSPSYSDYMSNFSPSSVMGYTAQNYGTTGNIFGSQMSAAAQSQAAQMNMLGSLIGAGGAMGAAGIGLI